MTTYISGSSIGQFGTGQLEQVELRVISNLLQQDKPNSQQDDLRILRNDQAFDLGFQPPVVPGN